MASTEAETAETGESPALASHKASACLAISAAVLWPDAARWSLMDTGSRIRKWPMKKRSSTLQPSGRRADISFNMADGRLSPMSGWRMSEKILCRGVLE